MSDVSYPPDNEPHILWDHIDGPLLVCRDGTTHWLTFMERVLLTCGLETIESIEGKYLHNGGNDE